MTESTKALIGGGFASVTLLGMFALMADCSKSVSRTGAEAVEACVRAGGQWVGGNGGDTVAALDFCSMPDKRK